MFTMSSLKFDKLPWSREAEALLLELIREHRNVWDPKEPDYHKIKLRQEVFSQIARSSFVFEPTIRVSIDVFFSSPASSSEARSKEFVGERSFTIATTLSLSLSLSLI